MTTTALVPAAPVAPAPRGLLRPVARPEQVIEVHKEAAELIRAALEQGRDYGVIPGTGNKPALLKPGAERLCVAFGLGQRIEIVEHEIDHDREVEWRSWNRKKNREESGTSRGLYRYVVRCVLTRDGVEVGSGIGSCSTMESKYVRDPRSAENTVVKMASKRALVAAVLSTLALSDRFTQDVDDGEPGGDEVPTEAEIEERRKKMAEAKAAAQAKADPPAKLPEQAELEAAIGAEYDRLRIVAVDRREHTWRILGRRPTSIDDLRDVLAVLKELSPQPLEGEVVDEKKEGAV